MTDMVSRSGVAGSRYGFVVLMKVTVTGVREEGVIKQRKQRTSPWNVQPDSIIFKGVFVGIEALQGILIP